MAVELTGDWAVYLRIAKSFTGKIPANDREDWLQGTMLEMAKVNRKYRAQGKHLTEAGMMKVASYEFRDYWAKRRYELYGVNCTHCSKEQRKQCRTIEKSECPKKKTVVILRLNKILRDEDGGRYEFGNYVQDNNSIDLAAWVDARQVLRCLSKPVKQAGYKLFAGYILTPAELQRIYQRRHKYNRNEVTPRVFIYNGKEFPDPHPGLTPDEVRKLLMVYFPELADAEVRGYQRDGYMVFEMVRRAMAVEVRARSTCRARPQKAWPVDIQRKIVELQQKHWTLAALADKLGFARVTLEKWKSRERYPADPKAVLAVLDRLEG